MILGVDFDNTLVCYDNLFYAAAAERRMLPEEGPRNKREVRQWLIDRGREKDFTLLQGYVYGPGIESAPPYPDALACVKKLRNMGVRICIISHKTATPHLGPPYDLRRAAGAWLEKNRFFSSGAITPEDVFFADSLEEKAARAADCGCSCFIDDMKTFLVRSDLPRNMLKIWFCPSADGEKPLTPEGLEPLGSWAEIIVFLVKTLRGEKK